MISISDATGAAIIEAFAGISGLERAPALVVRGRFLDRDGLPVAPGRGRQRTSNGPLAWAYGQIGRGRLQRRRAIL
jgi:hypothetical protein